MAFGNCHRLKNTFTLRAAASAASRRAGDPAPLPIVIEETENCPLPVPYEACRILFAATRWFREVGHVEGIVGGRYLILRSLGAGGMGDVYLAQDELLEREIALKVIKSEYQVSPYEQERFLAEARAVAALRHPNTVRVFDYGHHEVESGQPAPYIAMEYIEGGTLDRALAAVSDGTLSLTDVIDCSLQVADAINEAHAKGILHRDLKPANIMLTRLGRHSSFVKVLDFGLALKFERGPGGANLARLAEIAGTPLYMSPEQLRGDQLGPGTDVYSLGVVIYEMVSGSTPLKGPTLQELQVDLLHKVPEPLDRICAGVRSPPLLVDLVQKCLEKAPAKRPAGMEEIQYALLRIRDDLRELEEPEALSACPKCTHKVPENASFCSQCGTKLGGVSCPHCSAPAFATDKVCTECGNYLHAPGGEKVRPQAAGRVPALTGAGTLRYCTMLMLRAESLELSGSEPTLEDVFEREERFRTIAGEVLTEFGATWIPSARNEIHALFGWEKAEEKQAEEALKAAVALLARLPEESGLFIGGKDRLVLTSGLMQMLGSPRTGSFSLSGDAFLLARLLTRLDVEDRFLADFATYKQVRWLCRHSRIYRSFTLPGTDRQVAFVGVEGLSDRVLDTLVLRTPVLERAPLVGREAELAQLKCAFERVVLSHEAVTVQMSGRAGVGKTRLLYEFLKFAEDSDERPKQAYHNCATEGTNLPYEPFLGDIFSRCSIAASDTPEQQEAKIAAFLDELCIEGLLPFTVQPLAVAEGIVSLADRGGEPAGTAQTLTRAGHRPEFEEVALDSVASFYEALAQTSPLILALDNADSMAPATIRLLTHLRFRLAQAPLLLVLSLSSETHDIGPLPATPPLPLNMRLKPLKPGETDALLQRLTAHLELPGDVRGRIHALCGGNPRFLEDIIENLADEGLFDEAGKWRPRPELGGYLPIPPTLESVMQARLDRLSEEHRTVLTAAAVIGTRFWQGGVEDLLGGSAQPALRAVAAAGLLRQQEPSLIQGETQYIFAQNLTREIIHSRLPEKACTELHARAAHWLKARVRPDSNELNRLVADHFLEGSMPDEASPFLLAFAKGAERRYANEEALEAYRTVLQNEFLRPDFASDLQRTGSVYAPAALGAGRVARRTGKYELGEQLLTQALNAARQAVENAGSPEGTAGLVLDLRFSLGETFESAGRWGEALGVYDEVAAAIADHPRDHPELWAKAWSRKAAIHLWKGKYEEALAFVKKGLASTGGPPSLEIEVRTVLASCHLGAGNLAAAVTEYRAVLNLLADAGDLIKEGQILSNLGLAHAGAGEVEKAEARYREAIEVHARAGYEKGQSIARANLGELYLAEQRTGEAQDVLAEALTIGRRIRANDSLPEILRLLALARLELGLLAEAEDNSDEAVALAEQVGSDLYLADALAAKARVMLAHSAAGDEAPDERARNLLERAADLFRKTDRQDRADECLRLIDALEKD